MSETEAETPKAKKGLTEYLVLIEQEGGYWEPQRIVSARSPKAAISQVMQEPGGTYVAVPSRHWLPLTPEVETQTRIVFK